MNASGDLPMSFTAESDAVVVATWTTKSAVGLRL
jgi:hypothetical protein